MSDYKIFEAGDVVLQSGLTYRAARLAYKTHGTLNVARSNVIVYPTSYGAQHPDLEWLIAPGKPVDSFEANFRRRDANDLLAMVDLAARRHQRQRALRRRPR